MSEKTADGHPSVASYNPLGGNFTNLFWMKQRIQLRDTNRQIQMAVWLSYVNINYF